MHRRETTMKPASKNLRSFSTSLLPRRLIVWVAAWLLSVLAGGQVCGAEPVDLAFVQIPVGSYESVGGDIESTVLSGRYLEGMEIAVASSGDVAGSRRVISGDFVCATDPCFSPDGTRLLFCGKRSLKDRLQIWETSLADAETRQVLVCDADCVQPLYLPNGHVAFASTLAREYEEHGGRYSLSLYEWSPDYEAPDRLTFNPSSEFDPLLLEDGRLVFSSWQHVGNHYWPDGNVALLMINWNGTGVFPLTGNHRQPWFKRGAVQLNDGVICFIQSDELSEFGSGALVSTDLNDPFADYLPVVDSERFEVADAAGKLDGSLVVAARPVSGQDESFGLYLRDGDRLTPLYDSPDHHELNVAVYDPQRDPDTRFSTVVPGTPYGYLLVLNCFESDRVDQSLLSGDIVNTVRVIEGMPVVDERDRGPSFVTVPGREDEPMICAHSATNYIPSRILGEVPPASDGSIYLMVPADRPIRLQLIDRQGLMVMNERAWFWVRPNERRVCIGCHADRELAPNNKTALAAQRMPTDLTDSTAWRTVDFRHDVRPILSSRCAVTGCHTPPHPTAGMNLKCDQFADGQDAVLSDRFDPAYANLLKRQEGKPYAIGGRRVNPGDSRASPLMWMLYGRVLGSQYAPAPFDTPINSSHPGPMLPEECLKTIRTWIDLGAVYDDRMPAGGWVESASPEEKETGDGH